MGCVSVIQWTTPAETQRPGRVGDSLVQLPQSSLHVAAREAIVATLTTIVELVASQNLDGVEPLLVEELPPHPHRAFQVQVDYQTTSQETKLETLNMVLIFSPALPRAPSL